MKNLILALFIGLGSITLSQAGVPATNNYVKLTPELFDGYQYDLISNIFVEQLLFLADNVLATFGRREGPVTAPLLNWKLEGDKTLFIHDDQIKMRYIFIKITDTEAVTTDGRHYRRSKEKTHDKPTKK